MNPKTLILSAVLIAFTAVSAVALAQHGYLGIWNHLLLNSAGWQVGSDIVIACSLLMVWMVMDARRSGRIVWPFLLITLVLGSFGPLLYLLLGALRQPRTGAVYA